MTAAAPNGEIGELRKSISQRQIDMFTPVRPGSIHTDAGAAEAHGFRGPLAQGLMSVAYIAELMTAAFGADFIVGGKVSVSFIEPVCVGDELTVTATVKPATAAEAIEVDVRCVNQTGSLVTVGTASARAAASSGVDRV